MTSTATTIQDLSTATPAGIDTEIAAIHVRYYLVQDQIETQQKYLAGFTERLANFAAGRRPGFGKISPARLATMAQYEVPGWEEDAARLTAKIDTLQAQAREVLAEADPHQAEYRRRGCWSRFFLVKNNGGHIHSSMNCSTCNKMGKATRFGWLPELSGQTDVDAAATAIATHGSIFCTTCFPDAPVAWTNGTKPADKDICSGSGRYYDASLPSRTGYYSGNWATCPGCHTPQTITASYLIRKHKTPKAGA